MNMMKKIAIAVVLSIVVGALSAPTTLVLATFGIDPGKVFVDNLFPGSQAEFSLVIYNQDAATANYIISAREPDYTQEGYDALPYLDWIGFDQTAITVEGDSTALVQVTISMPENADYSAKRAEVWISVREAESEEMIQVELASRVMIGTRDESGPAPNPAAAPTIINSGSVGITAAGPPPTTAGNPVNPPPPPVAGNSAGMSPWAVVGIVVFTLVGGTVAYLLINKRRRIRSAAG